MNTIAKAYTVRSVLGRGSTGVVYDALRKDGSNVVVKVMHPEFAANDDIRERFRRESPKLAKLSGPHIRPILDSGAATSAEGEAQLYMARAKVEGLSLGDLFASGEQLPVDRGLDIVDEICDALRLAHDRGILHRNLKPSNVLLEQGRGVVVVDFGLSQIVSDAQVGAPDLTANNKLFGAPEYMSPEQAMGEPLDERCDVYSVGVILYEILTGSPPFFGKRPLAVLSAHFARQVEPPTTRAPAGRVSPELERVVLRALARDRNDRYESIEALQDAIASVRQGHQGSTTPPPSKKTSSKPAASSEKRAASKRPGSPKQAGSAKQAASPKRASPSRSAAPPSKMNRSNSRWIAWGIVLLVLAGTAGAAGIYWDDVMRFAQSL